MAFSTRVPQIQPRFRPSTNSDDLGVGSGSRRTPDFRPAGSNQRQNREENRRPSQRAVTSMPTEANGSEMVISYHPCVPASESFVVEIGEAVKEYLSSRNIQEAIRSLEALPSKHHHLFIHGLTNTALEHGQGAPSLVRKLLRAIHKDAVVSSEDLGRGLLLTNERVVCISNCDDTTYEKLVRFILSAGLDADELIERPSVFEHEARDHEPSDHEPDHDTGECSSSQSTNEASCSMNPSSVVSQESFIITAETLPDDIVRYFEEIANVRNYTNELDHDGRPKNRRRGGCADVYQVATIDNKHVAVKCIYINTGASGNKTLKRTARELEVWSTLRHENILPLLGLAKYDNCVAMVSTWMGLGSVVAFVRDKPDENRYNLSRQIVQAVVYLHGRGIVHGDIKGENVLMSDDGKPKLTDFGLTVMIESKLEFSATTGGGGTMRWMAPELFVPGGCRSKAADVYALGMTLLEVLTGDRPFSEIENPTSIPDVVRNQRQTPCRPERLMPPSPLKDAFWEAMTKCWAFEPTNRAKAMEIERLIASGPTPGELGSRETVDFD